MISNNIFSTTPIPNGSSWSIVSKLGYILNIAESKYGKRNQKYTILGIELTDRSYPQIWFPSSVFPNSIIIQITDNRIGDLNGAIYQLAHETIHCLGPHPGINANVLEEGLATHFSAEYMDQHEGQPDWHPAETDYKYVLALKCIKKALEIDSNIITKLVAKERNFVNITEDMILEVSPEFPRDLAKILTTDFYDDSWIELANKIE